MKALTLVCLLIVAWNIFKVKSSLIKDFDLDNDGRARRQTLTMVFPGDGNSNEDRCKTPYGQDGSCKTISNCQMPHLKDNVMKILDHLCVLGGSKFLISIQIGICCPDTFKPQSLPRFSSIDQVYNQEVSRIVNNPPNRPEDRGCGITTKQFPRITGGRPADPDEWPWMVAILRKGYPSAWCGGALITDRHILTAAHCIYKLKVADLFARLGEYDFKQFNETRSRDFRIAAMVHHIDFDPLNYENDIALIRIEKPTIFNTYVWPVCMPPIGEMWEGYNGIVTGWGTQHFGGPSSNF
uniref:Peptidase S1 domain-containing protein n=1 Tax=Megaselia scalaris TaxID=36166 RepID=T1GQQ4_MEGSC